MGIAYICGYFGGWNLAANEINISPRDIDRLAEWMRRTGRPQTVRTLARRYLEVLREERGIRDTAAGGR
jgi:hypothetical protein